MVVSVHVFQLSLHLPLHATHRAQSTRHTTTDHGTGTGAGPLGRRPEAPGDANRAARLHTECAAPAAVMDGRVHANAIHTAAAPHADQHRIVCSARQRFAWTTRAFSARAAGDIERVLESTRSEEVRRCAAHEHGADARRTASRLTCSTSIVAPYPAHSQAPATRARTTTSSLARAWWAAAPISCAPHVRRRLVVIRRFGRVMRVHEGTRRPCPSRDRPPSIDAARSDRLTMPQTLLLRISGIEPGVAHEPRQPIIHNFRPHAWLVGASVGGRVCTRYAEVCAHAGEKTASTEKGELF